jgi:hypothetical protein
VNCRWSCRSPAFRLVTAYAVGLAAGVVGINSVRTMRLSRLIATAAAVAALVLPATAAGAAPPPPEGGLPNGYVLSEAFGVGPDASCRAHFKGDWHNYVQYKDPFFWVRGILISDAVFANGDYCRIGPYTLTQSGGDLLLLRPDGVALWCMCYRNSRASTSLYSYFQGFDGNLVSYTSGGLAVGASDTCCITSPYRPFLAIQSDGNLVVYRYRAISNTYEAMWATNTAT